MITIRSNAKQVAAALDGMQKQFPKEFASALKTLGMGLKKKAGQSLKRNTLGLPRHDPLTRKMNKALGRKTSFGGTLSKSIRSYVRNGTVKIGWPDGLRLWGETWQSRESRDRTPAEKHKLFRLGVATKKNGVADAPYKRPARVFWKKFAALPELGSYAVDLIRKRIQSIIDKAKV